MLPERKKKIAGLPQGAALYALMSTDLNEWLPVRVSDEGDLFVEVRTPTDEITSAVILIDSFHHEIHEGESFIASQLDDNLADDGVLMFHLTPGPSFSHLVFTGACGGDATLEFMEDPTIAGGAAVSERNLKRTAAEPGDTVVLSGAAINAVGTLIFECLLPGGTGGNAVGGVMGLRPQSEFILDPDKTYAVRLTNIAGNAKPACLIIEWYEESDN